MLALLIALATLAADPAGYHPLFATHFDHGLDAKIDQQKPSNTAISVVPAPGRKGMALRVTLRKTDDFSHVVNGSPRAELSFHNNFRIDSGRDHIITWSHFLPPDFKFDAKQPEIVFQIHQGGLSGSPPVALMLEGDKYILDVRGGDPEHAKISRLDAGSAAADRGRWVSWKLRYLPSPTADTAIIELTRDGKPIVNAPGALNAYVNDPSSYLKLGVYKGAWQKQPSDVTLRTVYYGDVGVWRK
jgi:hypothetical protein